MVQNNKGTDRFAIFGIHAANNIIRESELDALLDIRCGSDLIAGSDKPNWYTCVEKIVACAGIPRKAAHPVRLNFEGGPRRVRNAGLDQRDIVQKSHDVKEVSLRLSNVNGYITEGERMVEE